jgi:plasmid stabilization system protein ParE
MVEIRWTSQAADDLEAIAEYIAIDSEHYARLVVIEIVTAVELLAILPERGRVVPEIRRPDIRELLVGSYRLIYRYRDNCVEMLTVYHGARLLRPELVGLSE